MRIAKGITQAQLAKAIGIRPPSLCDIENGITKSLKANTVLLLSRHLECSADWLNTGKGNPALSHPITSVEESELIALFANMTPQNQQALLATARALHDTQEQHPNRVNPFPKVPN